MKNAFCGLLLIAIVICGIAPADASRRARHAADDSTMAVPGVWYATLGNTGPDAGSLITVDSLGVGALVGPTGIVGGYDDLGVPALAIKSTGEMLALDIGLSANLYRIDAFTGTATFIATTGLDSPPAAAFDGNDVLWVVDSGGDLYTVDDTTGAATLVGATGIYPKGLDFQPSTGVLWACDASGGVYTISHVTAAPTLVGNTGQNPSPDLLFDANGALYASSGGGLAGNNLIEVDTLTGVGIIIGSIGFQSVSGMSARLARVPPAIVAHVRDAARVVLQQNYPNPFNPTTTIDFAIDSAEHVTLSIYDVSGRRVTTLVDGTLAAGAHSEVWDGRDAHGARVASGVYFYRLTAGQSTRTRKAILSK